MPKTWLWQLEVVPHVLITKTRSIRPQPMPSSQPTWSGEVIVPVVVPRLKVMSWYRRGIIFISRTARTATTALFNSRVSIPPRGHNPNSHIGNLSGALKDMARITEIRRILATASNEPKRISHHLWSARRSSHKPNSVLSNRNMWAISLTSTSLAWCHNKTKLSLLACLKKLLCSLRMSTITARKVQGIPDRCRMLAGQLIMVGRICSRFIQLEIIRQASTPQILQTQMPAEANLRATGRSSSSAIRRKTLSSSNSNKCLLMLVK